MSAPDPLREALSAALSLHMAQPPNSPWQTLDAKNQWRSNLLNDLETAAREAFAAVPAEPEAWEWGFEVKLRPDSSPAFHLAVSLNEAVARASNQRLIGREGWTVRRHPGTAPGQWERVDPEPRLQDGEA